MAGIGPRDCVGSEPRPRSVDVQKPNLRVTSIRERVDVARRDADICPCWSIDEVIPQPHGEGSLKYVEGVRNPLVRMGWGSGKPWGDC
jgi:hypothetical protein